MFNLFVYIYIDPVVLSLERVRASTAMYDVVQRAGLLGVGAFVAGIAWTCPIFASALCCEQLVFLSWLEEAPGKVEFISWITELRATIRSVCFRWGPASRHMLTSWSKRFRIDFELLLSIQ